jgi:hypothetical protein
MKIYRGPSERQFYDDMHQKVAQIDLSKDVAPWLQRKLIRVNISKKGYERSAVAHIEIEAADVLALCRGLIEGCKSKPTVCESYKPQISALRTVLGDIQGTPSLRQLGDSEKPSQRLKRPLKGH